MHVRKRGRQHLMIKCLNGIMNWINVDSVAFSITSFSYFVTYIIMAWIFRCLFWIFSAVSTIPVELMVMVKRKANNRQERKSRGSDVFEQMLFCTYIKKFCSYQSLNQRQLWESIFWVEINNWVLFLLKIEDNVKSNYCLKLK